MLTELLTELFHKVLGTSWGLWGVDWGWALWSPGRKYTRQQKTCDLLNVSRNANCSGEIQDQNVGKHSFSGTAHPTWYARASVKFIGVTCCSTAAESAADPITLRLAPKIAIAVATELAGLDLTALTVISWAFVVIGKKIPFKSTWLEEMIQLYVERDLKPLQHSSLGSWKT